MTAWLTFQAVACCGRRIPPYAGQDAIELTSLRVCHATIRCGTIIRLSFLQFASNCCSQQEASDVGQGGLPCWHDERASVDTLITLWYEFGQLQFSFSSASVWLVRVVPSQANRLQTTLHAACLQTRLFGLFRFSLFRCRGGWERLERIQAAGSTNARLPSPEC